MDTNTACLVIIRLQNKFSFFFPFFKPLKISLKFTFTPALMTILILRFDQSQMTVNCTATGDPKPRITWEPICTGQLPIERLETTDHSLTIRDLQPHDQGKYACVATSSLFLERAEFSLVVKTGWLIEFCW